jgi:hypothetical protein
MKKMIQNQGLSQNKYTQARMTMYFTSLNQTGWECLDRATSISRFTIGGRDISFEFTLIGVLESPLAMVFATSSQIEQTFSNPPRRGHFSEISYFPLGRQVNASLSPRQSFDNRLWKQCSSNILPVITLPIYLSHINHLN